MTQFDGYGVTHRLTVIEPCTALPTSQRPLVFKAFTHTIIAIVENVMTFLCSIPGGGLSPIYECYKIDKTEINVTDTNNSWG